MLAQGMSVQVQSQKSDVKITFLVVLKLGGHATISICLGSLLFCGRVLDNQALDCKVAAVVLLRL